METNQTGLLHKRETLSLVSFQEAEKERVKNAAWVIWCCLCNADSRPAREFIHSSVVAQQDKILITLGLSVLENFSVFLINLAFVSRYGCSQQHITAVYFPTVRTVLFITARCWERSKTEMFITVIFGGKCRRIYKCYVQMFRMGLIRFLYCSWKMSHMLNKVAFNQKMQEN